MSVKFPDVPMFSEFGAPCRIEADILDLEVEGEIPLDMAGSFYRVQPDFIYPPKFDNDVPFNGDGNVALFQFNNGHVDLKTRYVKTRRYKVQAEAREALFGTYRNPRTDDPRVSNISAGTANTNLIFHAGRLFALKEDSPPVQIDPYTLETLDDYYTFNDKLTSKTFTAHPKIDTVSGEMIGFGYEARGEASRDVAVYAIDNEGEINWEAWFEVPYAGLLHDFAITQTHITFLVIPMAVNVEQMKNGGVHFAWDSTLPTWFGVMHRGGDGSDLRWFKGPEKSATHVMNGFSDGHKVYVDMDMSTGNQFPFFPSLHEPFDFQRAAGRLTRLSVDLDCRADTYDMEILHPQIGVLPRTDERYWSVPYRVGFMPVTDPDKPRDEKIIGNTGLTLNTWTRFEHDNYRKTSSYFVGPHMGLQECQFVPRSKDAPEGNGYLIGLANNYQTMLTELHILDAEHLDDGPIGRVLLPIRLRNGVHGHWVPADVLPVDDSGSW